MDHKSRTKALLGGLLSWGRPVLLAVALIAILRVTGLMSAVTYATQWTILQTGLRDADGEVDDAAAAFDYGFTIKDLQGNHLSFEQFKGKTIFLNLWATWCGPCRAEMPGIQSLYEKVDKDKVVFVMLSIDEDSDRQKVVNYLNAKKFTFTAYMPVGYLPDHLQVPSIPTTFVISPEGKVAKKEVGTTQYDTPKFLKFLESLAE